MTSLEEALREAFGADVDGATDRMLSDVRRGARRRRTTRTALGAVAASAVVVGGIAFGGSLLSDDSRPSPAPKPTETVTDPSPADASPALAVEAAGTILYVIVDEVACSCSVLSVRGADEWVELHRFPVPLVDRLSFAPDAENGWAAAPGQLWSTHDAGQTWQAVNLPPEAPVGLEDNYVVDSSTTHVWVVNPGSGSLWRSPVGIDDFTHFDVPDTDGIQDVAVVGDTVVVDPRPIGEGNTTSVPRFSTSGSIGWPELNWPCTGEHRLLETNGAIFTTCEAVGVPEATIYRWAPGDADFTGFSSRPGDLEVLTPLTSDRLLLQAGSVLITTDGATPTDTGLTIDGWISDAAQVNDLLYLATTEGLLESTDGGTTWDRI